jgi:protocatechuate 3,4-dioxygenase beta subunit
MAAAGILVLAGLLLLDADPEPTAAPPVIAAAPAEERAAPPSRPAVAAAAERHQLVVPGSPSPAAAPPRPAPASLAVTVRWQDDGSPAAGVHVTWRTASARGPIVCADRAGVARFTGLAAARYFVGTAGLESVPVVVQAGAAAAVELRVARGFTLRGRVVDPDGAPVPFAEVLVAYARLHPVVVFPGGFADAQGRFGLERLGPDQMVGARHPRIGTSDFEVLQADSAGHELVLTVRRDGVATVSGRVVDGSGWPIAGAAVSLRQTGLIQLDKGDRTTMPPPAALATTDHDGVFAAEMLRPGARTLIVSHPDFAPHRTTFELRAGECRRFDVRLQSGATLVCSVRRPDRAAVRGAEVTLVADHPADDSVRHVDDGPVRFHGLPAGPCKLRVHHGAFAPAQREVTLPAAGQVALEFVLERGLVVRGRVVDDRGRPLAGRWVDLGTGRGRVSTGADGRFVLTGAAAADNTVQVRGTDLGPVLLRVAGVTASEEERTIVVTADCAPTARVRGVCLGVDGSPLAGAEVKLWQEYLPIEGGTTTAADGTFELGPLAPGAYHVRPAHRDAFFRGVDVQLQPHEVRELPAFAGWRERPR